jgi:hypothetical protein
MEEMNLMPTLAEAQLPMVAEQIPPELDDGASKLEKIKAADEARPGFPGEHWIALGLGIAMWQFTRKHRSFIVRGVGSMLATMLVARAASGRQGLSRVLRYTPLGKGIVNCPPCEQDKPR